MTPAQFGEFLRSESATLKRVIEQARVVLADQTSVRQRTYARGETNYLANWVVIGRPSA